LPIEEEPASATERHDHDGREVILGIEPPEREK